jgi:putative tricarboxylic transport membrane protein
MEYLILGIDTVFSNYNWLYCIFGIVLGTLVGVLPGLGPTATISMLLPVTYALGPIPSIIMLAGIYYGSQYGGSTTAILLNTPGESSAVMTCIDGHKMTQNGKAGPAIFAAGFSSFIAGIFATLLLVTLSPLLSVLALQFGPAEYCALIALGFLSVGILTTGDIFKGLGMCFIGVLIGTIGTDIQTGVIRFAFSYELENGIAFPIVAIGLFAFAEIIKNITKDQINELYKGTIQLFPSKEEFKRIIPPSIRGSLIGSLLGLVPGGSSTISSYAAYAVDKRFGNKKVVYGEGAIEGVAAPESANNAASQTGFIPLLSLGIPENATMALMLGALLLSGIIPGPDIVSREPQLFWGLAISMLFGNLLLVILNIPFIKLWVTVLRIPYNTLYPIILAICCLGIYSIHYNINDLVITAVLGLFGYIVVMLRLEVAPLMLGLILGPMLEEYFRRAMMFTEGSFAIFIERPIALVLVLIAIVLVVIGIINTFKRK